MSMVSELTSSADSEGSTLGEKIVERSPTSKRSQYQIPKKIHKAEREKLKRDHMNELFHELGLALEPNRQNNGKASILGGASRLLRDLLAQVESLRRENAALVSESRYVTVEKNELREENLSLEAEILNLQNELRERMQSNSAWGGDAGASPAATALTLQAPPPPPIVGPVYVNVIPPNRETGGGSPPKPPSTHVRRPHARYPTPSDSWPLRILSQSPQRRVGGRSNCDADRGSAKEQ